jgi:hypothetical protein
MIVFNKLYFKGIGRAFPLMFALFLVAAVQCAAQSYFNKRIDYQSPTILEASTNIIATDSGYITLGFTESSNIGIAMIALQRLNSDGVAESTKFLGDTTIGYYSAMGSLVMTGSGDYAFTGGTQEIGDTVDNRALLVKFNKNLDTLWTRSFGNTDNILDTVSIGRGLIATANHGYALSGDQYYYGSIVEMMLLTIDSCGNKIFKQTYHFGGFNYAHSVIATTDGGYAMGGYRYYPGPHVEVDPMVVKTDSLGNLEWYADIGSEYDDDLACVALAQDGNILAATIKADSLDLNKLEYKRLHIRSFSNSGTELWSKSYGKSYYFRNISKLKVAQNGNFVVVGTVPDVYPHIVSWIWLFTPDGDSIWYREYELLGGAESMNYLYDVNETPDGGFAACGVLYPFVPDTGNMDAWVLKLDSLGCEAPGECWVGINEPAQPEPLTVAGGELCIRPNPATTETHITWQGEASLLEVFSASGVRVWQCKLPPEQTQFRLNTLAWPHGLYLLRVFMQRGQAITAKIMKL